MTTVLVVEGLKMKYLNGSLQPTKEKKKSQKGSLMIEWIIECEECDNESYVKSFNEVCFCPICGMMTEPERQDDIEEELKAVLDF